MVLNCCRDEAAWWVFFLHFMSWINAVSVLTLHVDCLVISVSIVLELIVGQDKWGKVSYVSMSCLIYARLSIRGLSEVSDLTFLLVSKLPIINLDWYALGLRLWHLLVVWIVKSIDTCLFDWVSSILEYELVKLDHHRGLHTSLSQIHFLERILVSMLDK